MTCPSIEDILNLLSLHERRAGRVINMVPSENSLSALAKLPMLLDVYHRYFFNVSRAPDEWNFRGSQDVASLETDLAVVLLRELTGARHVNLRPLSGLSAMALVLSALGGGPGSTIMTVSPHQGGHYATAALAARLGLETCHIGGSDAHTIDFEGVAVTLGERRPALIYVDQSNCLFPLDVARLVEVARKVAPETRLHIDCSHWLGLVLGDQMPNPLKLGADSFGGSTHKSFPGPHKAVVATDREDLRDLLYQAQYEMISSHHFAAAISLGIALLEFRDCGGSVYAAAVVENTRELGRCLAARDLPPEAADRGFSCGHQLWLRTAPAGTDAYEASDRLYRAGIRVNAFPELPGIAEKVLRLGVAEATYHGLEVSDMDELAAIITAAVLGTRPEDALAERVAALRGRYRQPFSFPCDDPRLQPRLLEILSRAFEPSAALDLTLRPAGEVARV